MLNKKLAHVIVGFLIIGGLLMPDFIYPATKNVTSPFRPDHRPNHNGVDFADGSVQPIYASASGTVSRSYVSDSYGEVIFIKHVIGGKNYETVYAHMETGTRRFSEGDTVSQGTEIGTMGNTGESEGLHLHFELNIPEWVQGGANAVDPIPYLEDGEGQGLICKNDYLTRDEMQGNADHIATRFLSEEWTKEAIAGMLGNMERESTINPCLWQDRDEGNTSKGLGLVQWTPATNLIDWAEDRNIEATDMQTQISRILYELDNGLQWIPTDTYSMSFEEYTKMERSPQEMASIFLKNYERAGVEEEAERRTNALYWYRQANWDGEAPPEEKEYKPWLLSRNTNMRRMGVRGRR